MKFNNLQELLEEKEKEQIQQNRYERAAVEAKNNRKQCKRRNKNYWNPIIDNYQNIAESHQNEVKKINNLIIHLSNYPKELIIPFIMECINLYEDETYTHRMIVLTDSLHLTSNETLPSYSNYDLIFPERLLEEEVKLEKTFYISVLQIAYKELFESFSAKYTLLPSSGYLQILSENLKFSIHLENFPYLKEIFINLLDRRLKEPNKKMQEILDDELASLKEEQKRKLKD